MTHKDYLYKDCVKAGIPEEIINNALLRLGDEGIEKLWYVLKQFNDEELNTVMSMLSKLPLSVCPQSTSKIFVRHESYDAPINHTGSVIWPQYIRRVEETKKIPDKGLLSQICYSNISLDNLKKTLLTLSSIPTDELNEIWSLIDEGARDSYRNFDFTYLFHLLPEEIVSILRNAHQVSQTPYAYVRQLNAAIDQACVDHIQKRQSNRAKAISSTASNEGQRLFGNKSMESSILKPLQDHEPNNPNECQRQEENPCTNACTIL